MEDYERDRHYTAAEATEAIEQLIRKVYGLRFVGYKNLTYNGPDLTHDSLLATGCKIGELVSAEDFRTAGEQGVNPLRHLLFQCYQLGFNRAQEERDDNEKRYGLERREESSGQRENCDAAIRR